MEKVTIEVIQGKYGSPDWGNEYAVVRLHNQEIYRTCWFSNGARGEAEIWCKLNQYTF